MTQNRKKIHYLEVRQKYQDFLKWLFNKISQFPKTQKFILGEEIGKLSLKILKDLIFIQYDSNSNQTKNLKQFNLKLENFRALMSLAYAIKLIGKRGFLFQEQKIDEMGRMVYGLTGKFRN